MRCGQVWPLIDRYVDGALDVAAVRVIEAHTEGCPRCAARIRAARRLVDALSGAPPVRAPWGFLDKVMETVYREALAGPARAAVVMTTTGGRRAPARAYRRLGISFVLTAGVLAVSLLVPRAAYPTLIGGQESGRIEAGGADVVRGALDGADNAMREILREQANGGNTR